MASKIVSMHHWGYMTIFLVAFSSVRDCNAQACGGNFTDLRGAIASPFYPYAYIDNMECIYVITAPTGYRITLSFLDFILEAHASCSYDFVEVYDGGYVTSPLLGYRFCGATLPPVQRTSQNVMLIRFKTDVSGTYRGFSASYTSDVIPYEFMLLATVTNIYRIDVETVSYTQVWSSANVSRTRPVGIHYDPFDDRVYWTDVFTNEIRSIFPNGSGERLVRSLGPVAIPDGIAVDSQSRLVFYTDAGNKIIALIMISTFEHRFLITTKLDLPRGIVLDTINGIMFWTDWGANPKIERSNYDGTDRRELFTTDLQYPNALALDATNDRLYWADGGTDRVEWSNTNGNFRTTIYSSFPNTFYFALTLFKNKLFATDWTSAMAYTNISYVYRINIDGTNLTRIIQGSFNRFHGLHMYSASTSKPGPNACGLSDSGCTHICIPSPGNITKCMCPDGQILLLDQKTCSYGNSSTISKVTTTTPSVTTTTTSIATSSMILSTSTTTPVITTTRFVPTTTTTPVATSTAFVSTSTTTPVATSTDFVSTTTMSSTSDTTSSTKSAVFSSTSSSTAKSPRPPNTVTIKGNKLFATDGSYEMTLTCESSDVTLVTEFTWNVQCLRKQNGTCTFKPQPPEDDGRIVTCTATDIFGQSATDSIYLELNYPPSSPPVIIGYESGEILQTGSSITMRCTVKGGKPIVDTVLFSCPSHLDTPDIIGQNEVLSILTINPIKESDGGTTCVCTAVWKLGTLYRLSDSRKLKVNGTELTPDSGPTVSIPMIVGGAAGGVCVLIIVIVIVVIVIKKRKGTQLYDHPQPQKQKDNELTDPYTIFNQQFQNDVSRDDNSIYNEIGDVTEPSSVYLQSASAVQRAIHGHQGPVYEFSPPSSSIHYGVIGLTGCNTDLCVQPSHHDVSNPDYIHPV